MLLGVRAMARYATRTYHQPLDRRLSAGHRFRINYNYRGYRTAASSVAAEKRRRRAGFTLDESFRGTNHIERGTIT